jgi:hypothetical protein
LFAKILGGMALCLAASGCDSQSLNWPAALLSSFGSPLQVQPGDTLLGWAAAEGLDPPFGMTAWVGASRLFPWMDRPGLLQQQQQFALFANAMFPGYAGSFLNQNPYGSSMSVFVTTPTQLISSTLFPSQAVPAPFSAAGMIVAFQLSRRLQTRIQANGRSRR